MGILALEELDEGVADATAVEAAETATTVADESAEINTQADDVAVSVGEVEEAVQSSDELVEIGEVVQDSVESGEGLDEKSAELASIAIESIRSRLKDPQQKYRRLVPATESFGNTNTRLASSKLILEGIGDTLKRVWQGVLQFLKRIWDKIVSFVSGIANSSSMLKKHIKNLKERADGMSGGYEFKEKTIKTGIAGRISDDGNANLTTFDKLAKTSTTFYTESRKAAKHLTEMSKAVQGMDLSKKNPSGVVNTINACNANVKKLVESVLSGVKLPAGAITDTKEYGDKDSTDVKTEVFGPFVGGKALVIKSSTAKVAGQDAEKVKIYFSDYKGKKSDSLDALTLNQIQTLLADLDRQVDIFVKNQDTAAIFKPVKDGYEKLAKDIISSLSKYFDNDKTPKDLKEALQFIQHSVNAGIEMGNVFTVNATSLCFQTLKTGADYASICLANLKKE